MVPPDLSPAQAAALRLRGAVQASAGSAMKASFRVMLRKRRQGAGPILKPPILPNSFLEIEAFAGLRQMGLRERMDRVGTNVEDGVVLGALIARRCGLRNESALVERLDDQVDLRAMGADATCETARGRRFTALVLGQNEHHEGEMLVSGDAGVAGKARAHYGAGQQMDGRARLQRPRGKARCGRFCHAETARGQVHLWVRAAPLIDAAVDLVNAAVPEAGLRRPHRQASPRDTALSRVTPDPISPREGRANLFERQYRGGKRAAMLRLGPANDEALALAARKREFAG